MPPAVPFRDRPVLEHIVEQHAEEAAFLWTLRDAATEAPHYKRHHLARLDERVEAHVDGLRVAGEAGWRIALEQLERRCEKGELFAAGVLALESGDMRRIDSLVARAEAEPEARRGFVGAVAWCRPGVLAPTVQGWDQSTEAFERYLALCACSVHRSDEGLRQGLRLAARIEDEDALVRARALRLAGELGRVELLETCLAHLDDSSELGPWAAWAAVLLGDRTWAPQALGKLVPGQTPGRWAALEVAIRAMGTEGGARLVRTLNGDGRLRRAVTVALGHLGDPAAVPWLMGQMEDPVLARVAGESFAMITGADLSHDDLERNAPPEEATPTPDGEHANNVPAHDPDEHLPWPDVALVRTWWNREGRRFARGTRHLRGRPIDVDACKAAWQEGQQRQRRAAAYEFTLMEASGTLLNWDDRV